MRAVSVAPLTSLFIRPLFRSDCIPRLQFCGSRKCVRGIHWDIHREFPAGLCDMANFVQMRSLIHRRNQFWKAVDSQLQQAKTFETIPYSQRMASISALLSLFPDFISCLEEEKTFVHRSRGDKLHQAMPMFPSLKYIPRYYKRFDFRAQSFLEWM